MNKNFYLIYLILLFLIISCGDIDDRNYAIPSSPYNIKFEPNPVKIGENLTITFDMKIGINEWFNDLTVDESNKLKYIGNAIEYINTDWDCLSKNVEFGIIIDPESIVEKYIGSEFKHLKYDGATISRCDVFADYFEYIEWGKIVCRVPDNARSGYMQIFPLGVRDTQGFSDYQLTVLDESGDQIIY